MSWNIRFEQHGGSYISQDLLSGMAFPDMDLLIIALIHFEIEQTQGSILNKK